MEGKREEVRVDSAGREDVDRFQIYGDIFDALYLLLSYFLAVLLLIIIKLHSVYCM